MKYVLANLQIFQLKAILANDTTLTDDEKKKIQIEICYRQQFSQYDTQNAA